MNQNIVFANDGQPIYRARHYSVFIAKMPDLPSETYAIVNNDTNVIENLQPILYNARKVADEFSKWLDGEDRNHDGVMQELDLGMPN